MELLCKENGTFKYAFESKQFSLIPKYYLSFPTSQL